MNYDFKANMGEPEPVQARAINSSNWWDSLRDAENAFAPGYAAKARHLAIARVGADFDSTIWCDWITPVGEELKLMRPNGKTVYINIHGRGLITSPHLTGRESRLGVFKITAVEKERLLRGQLPDGTKIPFYTFEEVRKFKRIPGWGLPAYAIFSDGEIEEEHGRLYAPSELIASTRYFARIGDPAAAYSLARKLEKRYGEKKSVELTPYGGLLEPDTGALLSFGPAFKKETTVKLFPPKPTFLALSRHATGLEDLVA